MVGRDRENSTPGLRFASWAPFPIAVVMAIAAVAGIADRAVYARETASWAAQGTGQDWINLVVCAPALLVAGGLALRGSRRARFVVGGLLLYVAYSYVIYAFAMHFTRRFLIDCALLGASTFAVIDLVGALREDGAEDSYDETVPRRLVAGTLVAIAGVFGALWLSQIVPAVIRGVEPAGLDEVGLVANPVHVLDLSLVLPAMIVVGVALLRRRAIGAVLAPMLLAFGVVMAIAIGGMVAMMAVRGLAIDAMPTVVMAVIAAWCAAVLIVVLRHVRRQ